MLAPKGTPLEAPNRISEEVAKAAARPEKLLGVAQVAEHQSPADFGWQVSKDKVYFAGLIKELDIKLG